MIIARAKRRKHEKKKKKIATGASSVILGDINDYLKK